VNEKRIEVRTRNPYKVLSAQLQAVLSNLEKVVPAFPQAEARVKIMEFHDWLAGARVAADQDSKAKASVSSSAHDRGSQ